MRKLHRHKLFRRLLAAMLAGCSLATLFVMIFAEDQSVNPYSVSAAPNQQSKLGSMKRELPAYDYAVVWMSDTQYYSERYPDIYRQMTGWIAANQGELKLRYVVHTGDIVNRDKERKQWAAASNSMNVLERAAIPYGVLAGNHDVNTKKPSYKRFGRYFGNHRFQKLPFYGESYRNNRGHYDLIEAGKQKLIFVYMGWGIGEPELEWMNQVLKAHPNHKAILCLHDYMKVTGERSPVGEEVFSRIVEPNSNVAAVLCGHEHNAELMISALDDNRDGIKDRTVYQMLADYQKGPKGGEGYMRLLLFDEARGMLHVRTYSPYTGEFNFYKNEFAYKDEFTLPWQVAAS
ncbi:metallophosphoesterase [Paenibacillus sp. GCM10012307]|uniref:Metallophosphoesterase n=1 Tax=Paenibacillus roseus TaxID=2798579 RepID=A0A934J4N0_9BACL|nr:metallophosphoesterase [Paenibacillus roseus]MBJ6362790.1 metallophosphoesterase [Paenibacillus roseus]